MKKGKKLYEGKAKIIYATQDKGLVIQSAISEVMSIVGFVKSQLKTIIIDIKERF